MPKLRKNSGFKLRKNSGFKLREEKAPKIKIRRNRDKGFTRYVNGDSNIMRLINKFKDYS